MVSAGPLDFEMSLLPPENCDYDDEIDFLMLFDALFASEDTEVVLNALFALRHCLEKSSQSSEVFGPLFLDHVRDFMTDDDLRGIAISSLCHLNIEIPDISGLLNHLTYLLCDANEDHTKQVLLFYEAIADRYGVEPFGAETVQLLLNIRETGTYSLKIDLMFTIAKMIERGPASFHTFLLANGVLDLLDQLAPEPVSDELRGLMLESFGSLLAVDADNIGIGEELAEFVCDAVSHPDQRIAELARVLFDQLERMKKDLET
jgi:hypothetical protein